MLYYEIISKLNEVKYLGRLNSIYMDDKSLQFEDVVGDVYTYCVDESLNEITYEVLDVFLKAYYSSHRVHKHTSMAEEMSGKESYTLGDITLEDYDDFYINEFDDINLTDKEILCMLLIRDKSNSKKYDYDFVRRNSQKSINLAEIRKYHESIIKKLSKKLESKVVNSMW